MLVSVVRRFSQWLCLALALALGAVPTRGLVLCVGPEGSVSVEMASAEDHCGGCSEIAAENASDEARGLYDGTQCPCTDIPVVRAADAAGKIFNTVEPIPHWIVALQPSLGEHRILPRAFDRCDRAHAAPPNGARTLDALRTVVLHL
jgi:hypothetical protein